MTRNILIATIFTLGTAMLLAVIFFQEAPRLEAASGAITAERLERGARDYEQYCATCHGLGGQGGVQYAAPRLNNIAARKEADGSMEGDNGVTAKYGTLRNYIEATLHAGVRGAPMPAFGAQGTLRDDQIENITSYVLSWSSTVTDINAGYQELPEGVQARSDLEATRIAPTPDPNANPVAAGGAVFQNRGCTGCHVMTAEGKTGPGLGGLFSPEGTAAFGTTLPNNQPVNPENVRAWIQGGSQAFPENINDLTGKDWGVMGPFPLTDEEWEKLYVWLRVHDRDGNLTPEGQELQQQQGEGGEPSQNVPTVVPTGQAQPNTAPGGQAQPTSQVDTTADAESEAATAGAVETTTP